MKIETCPFCGKLPVLLTWAEINGLEEQRIDEWAVCCDAQNGGCGATGGVYLTPEGAIKKWNRRTTQP